MSDTFLCITVLHAAFITVSSAFTGLSDETFICTCPGLPGLGITCMLKYVSPDRSAGDSSSERNPVYMYETPGTYKITLRTKDQQLCQSSYDTTIVITPEDICNVKAGFEYVSQNDEVQFSNLSTPDNSLYSCLWDFGDNTHDDHQNPNHIYQSTGQYNVCLKMYRDPLCSAEVCDTVLVNIVRRIDAGVYPNPADTKIVAEFEAEVAAEITISVFNNNGIEIYNKRKNCMAGLNKEQVDIISLPKGSYVLKITGLNKSIIKRFIKQ